MNTIALLGASGYVGQAFQRALTHRKLPFVNISRSAIDYTDFDQLGKFLKDTRPYFLINAAGFTGKPNVDACESSRPEVYRANVLLPVTISHACQITNTSWGHVSSGCIFNGAPIWEEDGWRIEKNLNCPRVRRRLQEAPQLVRGFDETHRPNFDFHSPLGSFYTGTKALAEQFLAHDPTVYVWRLRLPFNRVDHARNLLSKLQAYPKVHDNINSLSHLDEFADACLRLWESRATFGVYNVTNPGFISSRQIVELTRKYLKLDRKFEFFESDEAFYREAAWSPRSNCILDNSKLAGTGIQLRPVEDALHDCLRCWQTR